MPRVLRRGHVLRGRLTEGQEWDLLIGGNEFASVEERRRAWREHAHELTTNETTRAAAWWAFDSPEPRNYKESSCEQLERLGLLTESEVALLAKWRRERSDLRKEATPRQLSK